MKHILTSLAVLISCASAHAEFVIDDFSGASVTLDAFAPAVVPATQIGAVVNGGTRDTTANVNTKIIFGGNSFGLETQFANRTINMSYTLTSPANLSSSGNPNLLLNLFNAVQGTYDLAVTLTSTLHGIYSFATVNVNSTGARGFDGNLAGLVGSSVNGISINITKTSPNFYTVLGTPSPNAKISANPEPASLALLGMTGLGGWFMARRRAKKTEAVV